MKDVNKKENKEKEKKQLKKSIEKEKIIPLLIKKTNKLPFKKIEIQEPRQISRKQMLSQNNEMSKNESEKMKKD